MGQSKMEGISHGKGEHEKRGVFIAEELEVVPTESWYVKSTVIR